MAPLVVVLSKLFRVKSVLFIHGLDIIADNLLFQNFFVPFIKKANYLIANSSNTKSLVESKGIANETIHIIHPGVEIPLKNQLQAAETFRQKFNLKDSKILLSVGRLIPRKGLAEFIEYSFQDIISTDPKIKLVIIGSEPQNALSKKKSVKEKIRKLILKNHLEEKILLLGKVDDDILQKAYYESDLFIFPLVETPGDVEGFGMVAIEAASFGLPVVTFDIGGVKDAVIDGETGFLVQPGNYKQLTGLIIDQFNSAKQKITHQKCIEHAQKFSWQNYGEQLRHFLAIVSIDN
jgi:phosphatidylinositol alpha-1,6-mannosyltransferase